MFKKIAKPIFDMITNLNYDKIIIDLLYRFVFEINWYYVNENVVNAIS